jgi:hypothetical protein
MYIGATLSLRNLRIAIPTERLSIMNGSTRVSIGELRSAMVNVDRSGKRVRLAYDLTVRQFGTKPPYSPVLHNTMTVYGDKRQ